MKKLLFALVLLFSVSTFAQTTGEVTVPISLWSTIKSIFLPAIVAQLLVLFADAKKWYQTEEWSWLYFFETKAKPFLLTTIGGIVLYIVLTYVPSTKPFISILANSPMIELTSASLFGAAAAIIDGFMKKKDMSKTNKIEKVFEQYKSAFH